jgi:hypothetical protein
MPAQPVRPRNSRRLVIPEDWLAGTLAVKVRINQ